MRHLKYTLTGALTFLVLLSPVLLTSLTNSAYWLLIYIIPAIVFFCWVVGVGIWDGK